GARIIFPNRPLVQFKFKLKCVDLYSNEIHKDGISCIRIKKDNNDITDYSLYLGILNSKLIGYFIYQTSSQWDTGEEKREKIKNSDVENIYIPNNSNGKTSVIKELVSRIKRTNNSNELNDLELKIDELVFNLYNLKEYQKEIIREFYQVKVERAKLKQAKDHDIEKYIEKFSEVFGYMLEKGSKMVAKYNISLNVGAVVCFTIVDENKAHEPIEDKTLEILHFVKRKQISDADRNKILNEDKVKIYENEFIYIIKSNQFKDWTIRQAIKDAREELNLMMANLPDR
ncbi:MAG: hypothetical protein K8R74_07020, partial [Bacteroidales bacterium]|nr:hypothetical protein [Bacteroidales bacterium]